MAQVAPHSIFSAAPGAGGAGALLWAAWHMGGLLLAGFGHGLSGGPRAPFWLGRSSTAPYIYIAKKADDGAKSVLKREITYFGGGCGCYIQLYLRPYD